MAPNIEILHMIICKACGWGHGKKGKPVRPARCHHCGSTDREGWEFYNFVGIVPAPDAHSDMNKSESDQGSIPGRSEN